jgi:hypothetical protein
MKLMSTQQNKALVHHLFEEGMNQNRGNVVDELIAPTYVNYNFPAPAPSAEGFKQISRTEAGPLCQGVV